MAALTNVRQERFCQEYLKDLVQSDAYVRAGYSVKGAKQAAYNLMQRAHVQARIAELQAKRAERTEITVDTVLRQLWDMATADPRELIEFRRTCCRFCYGEGHRAQRTPAEGRLDGDGGRDFDAKRPPNPACPECHGEGVGDAFVHDTRTLSAAARRLYAGVKLTKDGLEVKMHDQQAALLNVGKHLGMFKDIVETRDLTLEDLIKEAADDGPSA